jgi:hypothetical protein
VCWVDDSPVVENEVVHAFGVPLSSWHVVVVAPLTVNAKLALVMLVVAGGVLVNVTVGAVVSMVHEYAFEAEFPAPSVATTVNVCVPSARPE